MIESFQKLGEKIVKSWANHEHENFIIIAPPGSPANLLFDLLSDHDFIYSRIGEISSNFAISRLARTSFVSEEKFVIDLAKQWGVGLGRDLHPLEQLSFVTHEVINKNRVPILLIERFHEAMERLGEEFGTALRDLDHGLYLSTVVEFPISRKLLKLRWAANPNQAPFLNSDWGQMHTQILLKGYSRNEITKLVADRGGGEDIAKFLYSATGGLPSFVDRLIAKAGRMDINSYEEWVRSQAVPLAERMLDWLDPPGGSIYKRLVAQSLTFPHPSEGKVTLRAHPWRDLLEDDDGKAGCKLLAWAALDYFAEYDAKYISTLINAAASGKLDEVITQLMHMSSQNNPNWEVWKVMEYLCRLYELTDPFKLEGWVEAEKLLGELKSLSNSSMNQVVKEAADKMETWVPLIRMMSNYSVRRKSHPKETIEEFVSTGDDSHKKTLLFLNLLTLRLEYASKLNPFYALRAVITHPESIFRVYCKISLGITFWNYSGMDNDVSKRIEMLSKRPYTPPKKGGELLFFDMLCLDFINYQSIFPSQRLVLSESEFAKFDKLYKDRSHQVHFTEFVSEADWNEYYNYCKELSSRFKKCFKELVGDTEAPHSPLDQFFVVANFLQLQK